MSETTPSRDTVTQPSGPSEDNPALRAQALKRLEDRRGLMDDGYYLGHTTADRVMKVVR